MINTEATSRDATAGTNHALPIPIATTNTTFTGMSTIADDVSLPELPNFSTEDSWDLGNGGEPIFPEMVLPVDTNSNAIQEHHQKLELVVDTSRQRSSTDNGDAKTNDDDEKMVYWGEWDVPLGQSPEIQDFVGTQRYHALLDQHRSSYFQAESSSARRDIARAIFAMVHDRGGRFLDKNVAIVSLSRSRTNGSLSASGSIGTVSATASSKEVSWNEIAQDVALARIAQALEGIPSCSIGSVGEFKSSFAAETEQDEACFDSQRLFSPAAIGCPTTLVLNQQEQGQPPSNEEENAASQAQKTVGQSRLASPQGIFKCTSSMVLIIFCIVLVAALIFDRKTRLAQHVHPVVDFVVFWIAILWLSLVEGGQASMVGLPPIDRDLYKNSHPMSYRICSHSHRNGNLDRYLIGRQFMVLALVFIINFCGSSVDKVKVLNLPDSITNAFLDSGLAMILITCVIGQLHTQVNASHCMLDFINNWANWFTVKLALAIEASGLLHTSYLIQIVVFKLAGKTTKANEETRSFFERLLFWIRVVFSTALLIIASVATIVALFSGKTTQWKGIPESVSLIILLGLMCVVGTLEGMQIAFFAVAKLSNEERQSSFWASRTCNLLFRHDDQKNLPGFMVGRQLLLVACFFVMARMTSMDVPDGESNVLGVADPTEAFFDTGLLSAFVITITGSLAWQLIASACPLVFLSTPVTYFVLRLCLALDTTGICDSVWVFATMHRQLAGFQRDECYIGTAEERAAAVAVATAADIPGERTNQTSPGSTPSSPSSAAPASYGLLAGSAFPAHHYKLPYYASALSPSERRQKILDNIETLQEQITHAQTDDERNVYQAALRGENAALRQVVWR